MWQVKRKLFVCTWKGTEGLRLRLGKGEVTSSIQWIFKRFRQSSPLGHGVGARRCGWKKKKRNQIQAPSFGKRRRPEEKKFLNPETSSDKSRIISRGAAKEQNKLRKEAGRERGNMRGGVWRCHQTGGAVENKRGSTLCSAYLSEGLIHRWLC